MDTTALLAYYASLLIIQYRSKPNAQATISLFAAQLVADQIFSQVWNAFDLTTAVGAQLDILAKYFGISRTLYGYNGGGYFSMPDYADPEAGSLPGMANYTDTAPNPNYWLQYQGSNLPAYIMTDAELSGVLQYLAAVNSADTTLAEIDALMFQFFGTYVTTVDGANMTLTYNHDHTDPSTIFAIVAFLGALPSPAGVLISVNTI